MDVRRTSILGCLLAIVTAAPWAHAQPESLEVQLQSDGTYARAQFSILNAFTESFRKRMGNGLRSRAVLAVELIDNTGDILAIRQRKCELKLDVWDDRVYAIITDAPDRVRQRAFALIDDALKACGRVDLPIVTLDRLTSPAYRLRVRIALNPISKEMLNRSRIFMSNAQGTASSRTPAFFGAVARLFEMESEAGGTVFVFESGRLQPPLREGSTR